jgi:two-component system CheB/CheR fusion protein
LILRGARQRPSFATTSRLLLPASFPDGAIGIKRIKEKGGLTVAQEPEEAQFEGMPRSAIETGRVNWVLPVAEMPKRLIEYLSKDGIF